ncbi:uncharacterized protein C5orf60 isoform X2 [Hylobates moloch]|uniref:uncharacterized protein C5orf60 isoform X2 n=1 Tax=Hylobates moloch TaxID=81572 RepID=UPI0026766B8E|nr:uncharacterized protein C5orf60 isoform X2 [Hylobates moloch]
MFVVSSSTAQNLRCRSLPGLPMSDLAAFLTPALVETDNTQINNKVSSLGRLWPASRRCHCTDSPFRAAPEDGVRSQCTNPSRPWGRAATAAGRPLAKEEVGVGSTRRVAQGASLPNQLPTAAAFRRSQAKSHTARALDQNNTRFYVRQTVVLLAGNRDCSCTWPGAHFRSPPRWTSDRSVIGTELCPSPIPEIIHFVLFVVFSLVILIILRPYIPREPSSVPPREENSENDQAEEGKWIRIGNRYITLKDCRILLKEVDNLEVYISLAKKCLRKLFREGSSHHLPRQVRPGPVYKRAPARNHQPRGGRGKASPTSFHVSPRAPPAPLVSMPTSVPKISVESLGSPLSLSSSKPPEPLCPLKHPSHRPPASTLSPNPTTSAESLGYPSSLSSSKSPEPLRPLKHPSHKPRGRSPPRRRNPGWVSWTDSTQADSETDAIICPMCKAPERSCLHSWLPSRETPHAGRWRQGPHFPQPERANAAGRTRHQHPRHSHGHCTSDIHEQLGIS